MNQQIFKGGLVFRFFISAAPLCLISLAFCGEPLTQEALIDKWESRISDFTTLHVRWRSEFHVNLEHVSRSPFDVAPPKAQKGTIHLTSGEWDEFWLRGQDMKMRFAELNLYKGEHLLFRKEKNLFKSESRTKIENLAQGEIKSDANQLDLSNSAFDVLLLNYRPTSSQLYRDLLAAKVHILPEVRTWAGREAMVIAYRFGQNLTLEYYFDLNADAFYLGHMQKSSKTERRFEITHERSESTGLYFVREAVLTESLVSDGELQVTCSYKNYEFQMPRIQNKELTIEFDSGFLVGKQDNRAAGNRFSSYVVGQNGEHLPLNDENRRLLDKRVPQPKR